MSSVRCLSGGDDGKYVEPVEQVFPEPALFDLFLQIPVAGRDDPHIDLDGAGAAQTLKLALLKIMFAICWQILWFHLQLMRF
jgi:hypothetical protein